MTRGLSLVALAALALVTATSARGNGFLPPGALEYEEIRLENGLRIVLQEADSAPYVSARLVIKTGTDHFPCRDRELPHLVEHLLFSANATLVESEIDNRVSDWGGSINAYTYAEQTDIVLDAHARFQAEAILLLATMIRDFAPDDEDVLREAGVVERESGVEHSPLRLWWSEQPASWQAMTHFSVASGLACSGGIAPVQHLRGADVRQAFAGHYAPGNMILVLAGQLDDSGLAAARDAFSALPAKPVTPAQARRIEMPAASDYASGWLSGVASQKEPAAIGLSPFRDWEGYYVLMLAEAWLNDRLFRELRSELGIAYTPTASVDYHGTALSVLLTAQTRKEDAEFTRAYLRSLVDEVAAQGISEDDFERLRRGSLLGMAQSFERITDRADYLAASVREIESGGLFQTEAFYRGLDYERFRALLARDWPARFVVIDNSPRISWSARAWLLGGSFLLLAFALGLLFWRRLREARPG